MYGIRSEKKILWTRGASNLLKQEKADVITTVEVLSVNFVGINVFIVKSLYLYILL
jgi:hypothetical protein